MLRASLFGLILSISSFALAQDAALVPSTFRINDIKSSGDACRPGTVAVSISDDKEAFTVAFADFVVEKGPNATSTSRKFCRLLFDTEQDAGWEFAVLSVTMRGFAQLDAGVTARQDVKFGLKDNDREQGLDLKGPYEDSYVNSQSVGINSLRWSGCKAKATDRNRDFAVKASAQVKGGGRGAAGLLTVDTLDGSLEQVYEIMWRRCGDKAPRYVSSCEIKGNKGRTISVKGMGRNAAQANAKAQARLSQRCSALKGEIGRCDKDLAQCSLTSF